jgi:hypothetical protein
MTMRGGGPFWPLDVAYRLPAVPEEVDQELALVEGVQQLLARRAKQRSASREFIHLFNLLGDPATPIAIPDDAIGGSS